MFRAIAYPQRFGFVRPLLLATLVVAAASVAMAQSGTRVPNRGRSVPGSATRVQSTGSNVGLSGYCPVCVVEMKKWVKGSPEVQANYDGQTYLFPNAEQREMFLSDPAKYVPAFGGDCAVCYVNMGKRIPGSLKHAALRNNRLFLFPNDELKQEFLSAPEKFENADLALDGMCAVCRVELNQNVPGNPEIAVVHQGLRYLFPSAEQHDMFLANPAKYAVAPARAARP